MRFGKLRIAFSALCGLASVTLIVWWVRDYLETQLVASEPYAFPVLLLLGLTIAPWANKPTRFSLRVLLIATTLVAVVLGLLVFTAKK
jgi:hypothetical protein